MIHELIQELMQIYAYGFFILFVVFCFNLVVDAFCSSAEKGK